ncbi:MAG: hypothetical protein ABSG85_16895 [Spirochaetia bacterium]
MLGLLDKARKLRHTLGLGNDGGEEFAFDPDSGITREEQKEIRQEIEKVASRSRMKVSPEMFAVKAAKQGVLFPILVNIGAIVALAAGLAVLYLLFQRGESQAARQDTTGITAEGKLLAEVKKESEARLQEKNQQIDQIQGRLAEIDKQRQDLQANMDAKVQARESQLRASMTAELDAERARLQKQGLSDQDIQKRLADLEAQKNSAFNAQLAAFRTQADADRKKSESALQDLRSQFNADLAKANADRQRVLSDSRQREANLQAQLAQRTQELQSAQAQTQQQLAALTSQKQQEDLVSQQLVGLYSVAQTDIAAKNYPKALTSLQAISSYVNSSDVAVLPGIARRRPVDLFIVDSLTTLVQGEIDKGKVDTASLVDAANRITQVRTLVSGADGLLRAGRVGDAEAAYGQALAAIPEIGKTYAYFTVKARNSEAARQDALHAGLARAESAFAAGRYTDMLVAYRDALGYLPESSARLAATLSNIGAGAVALSGQKAQADQTQAAAPALAQANVLLQQHRYADAAGQYLAVLQSYPQSAQAGPSVKGINDSVAALSAQTSSDLKGRSDQVAALNAQLASVRKDISDRTTEITGIKKSLMNLVGMSGDPASTSTDVVMNAVNKGFGGLSGAQGASGDISARLQQAQNNAQALQKQIDALSAENERLKASPQTAAARPPAASGAAVSAEDARRLSNLDSLVTSYRSYIDQEDSIIRSQGEEKGRMRTIGLRDQFLGSLNGVFRGILDRIHQYDDRFITDSLAQGKDEGRQDALQQAMGVVLRLSRQTSADQRKGFIDAQLRDADKDPALKAFLKNLQILSSAMK